MRAREPDESGVAVSPDGVRIVWESFGVGEPTIVLLPSAPIIHSRQWKGQVPDLARRHQVITFDGRGNGRSDRPVTPEAFSGERIVADIGSVLDATATPAAVLVGLCGDGVWPAVQLAVRAPERVLGIVAISVGVPRLAPPHPFRLGHDFDAELESYDGWAKINRHHWRTDYADFARFFFGAIATEPHSTKVIDDCVEWALEGSVDSMIADAEAAPPPEADAVEAMCRALTCPMVIVHGDRDHCQPIARAERLRDLTGAPLIVLRDADHLAPGRHPVAINLIIRDFVASLEVAR
jgi:pimeloyl-ACP methyl ester carboxylesterase